jgi:hypothetical protein
MLRVIWMVILVCLALTGLAALVFAALPHLTTHDFGLGKAPLAWFAAGLFAGGTLAISAAASEAQLEWGWSPPRVLIGIILFSAALAACLQEVPVLKAGIAAALAILVVLAGNAAMDASHRGDPLSLQSSWGGLGGGLGGWQLSRSAGLLLVMIVAACAAVASLR